jgi:retron-type reverse transcriptase
MTDKANLEDFFSDKEIIKILCRKRAVAAKKGHDDHYYRNMSRYANSPHKYNSKELFTFFPSRSKWIRLDRNERQIRNTNSLEINAIQLERTIWREIKRKAKVSRNTEGWLNKLDLFIKDIQECVLNGSKNYRLNQPKIIPLLKDKKENSFRPLSVYELKDLIIISQVAKYLTYHFDPLFDSSSYAFRSGRNQSKAYSHHKAIEDILEFKKKMDCPIYVSECDIQKFFDCVNHNVIREKFNEMTFEAKEKLDVTIDKRAIHFFYSYLDSFSFNGTIEKNERQILAKHGIKNGNIPWVKIEELEKVGSNPISERIGIPQGGAISCLIANIILNYVDKVVKSESNENTFYGRFCDDMVLMHTNLETCKSLLETYQSALKNVKLISHIPQKLTAYGVGFWDKKVKSKLPYKWDKNSTTDTKSIESVPWVAFVGYQLRYDSIVRVRPGSIAKELKKQVSEVDKVIKIIRKSKKTLINKKAISFRVHQRLISMAIGRFQFGRKKSSMCWCSGFKLLKPNINIDSQIKNLDRNRDKQLSRLKTYLNKVKTPRRKLSRKVRPLKYYGTNFSYHKQFH